MRSTKFPDFHDKTITITGGAGSIGSVLVQQILRLGPKKLKILDINESGLFYLQEKIKNECNIPVDYFIADIRDKDRINQIIPGTDILFHVAALKHVPLCENNPFEAIKTNVFGTQNLIEVAKNECVEKFLTISTDKAVNPVNTMGATKLLSEKLTLNAAKSSNTTIFSCIRFGNVLNSIGSVIPIFANQISRGGPVTITDPRMTRFFMSMDDAVKLVIEASIHMIGGEIFILKMRTVRISDLAEVMIDLLASKYGYRSEEISIKKIGIRPGEKLFEELLNNTEEPDVNESGGMYIIQYNERAMKNRMRKRELLKKGYNSSTVKFIEKEELRVILANELEKL